jgi:hypothetical protein
MSTSGAAPAATGEPSARREVVVLDIDGVLADVRHRLHFLASRPKGWDSFFAAAADDPLLAAGADVARLAATEYRIVYLTGRPERIRRATADWLAGHGLPSGSLLMRSNADRRPSRLMKLERVRRIAATDPVALVVDDDRDVVATLRAAGFAVQLADWMPADGEAGQPGALFDVGLLQQAQRNLGRT